jgi:hypothetical protein
MWQIVAAVVFILFAAEPVFSVPPAEACRQSPTKFRRRPKTKGSDYLVGEIFNKSIINSIYFNCLILISFCIPQCELVADTVNNHILMLNYLK